MTSPRPRLSAAVRSGTAAARFALHGTDGGRDQQPTISNHLDMLRTAPAQLRQTMNDHHAAIEAVRQRANADDDLTPEGKRNSIAAGTKPIQDSTAAAVAALGTAVDNAHSALQQQSAATLPKPAAGVEGMLGRQAAWSRSQSLLSAGMSVPNLINETSDPETLHSLAEELPTYQRAQGASPDAAQAVTGPALDRLAEVAGEPAASARLAAREADVHHAGLQPLLSHAAAAAAGQPGALHPDSGVYPAVAAQQARSQVASGQIPDYAPDEDQDQPPAGTLRASIQDAMRSAARTPRQGQPGGAA